MGWISEQVRRATMTSMVTLVTAVAVVVVVVIVTDDDDSYEESGIVLVLGATHSSAVSRGSGTAGASRKARSGVQCSTQSKFLIGTTCSSSSVCPLSRTGDVRVVEEDSE